MGSLTGFHKLCRYRRNQVIRRIVAIAILVAALTLAIAIAAAIARLDIARAAVDSRVALARVLIASRTQPADLVRALATDEVHAVVEDHIDNIVYEQRPQGVTERDVPPVPPGAPPPPVPHPPAISEIERLVGVALGRPPERIGDPYGVSVTLAANLRPLARFLIADIAIAFVLLGAIGASTLWIVTGLWRASRKQLEGMLEERRVAASEYQRFLADAGHELRTPLTIVSGYVEILGNQPANGSTNRQILDGLRTETARMRALVEKMLLLARLETSVSIARLVDVADVAGDVVSQMRARYPNRELRLNRQSATIVVDQDDLHEAVRNLVENALRYAPQSPVEVDVTSGSSGATITVTDRGGGIAAEEREHIFERFYRGKSQTDGEGSGLGLAIVSRVAEQWNGAVDVESQPGRTVFALRFPLAEEELEHADTR